MSERDLEATLCNALAGRYGIERQLGAGGMALVFLARDLRHDRPVALKVLRPELAAAIGTERFLREIQIAARLHHPHILPLYDSGEIDGLLFYVMPFVEGESLRDRLGREHQLPVVEAVQIARDVGDALGYAHSRGVVHRDIKPANILLESGHALVADFGIARAIGAAGGERLTETGLAVGTPAYMSPEQAAGEQDLDGRADLYALGAVLYEMLAGDAPFAGPTPQVVLTRRLTESAPRVSTTRERIPAAVDDAVDRCLARVPADRFATAADLVAALDRVTVPPALEEARPVGARPERRRWVVPAVAALVLGAAVAGWLLLGGDGPAPGTTGTRPTVAVLPFENLGPPEDEYFADGITEEMTSRLAEISALAVTSRTSAMQYKQTDKSMREIGHELGVRYVLEGTIRTQRRADGAGEVRVTPQLIRVEDDRHLWTDRYTASLAPGEIFAVQAEIAEKVAAALDVALLASERAVLGQPLTTDEEAHNAYLLGRFHWNKRTPGDLVLAAEHFERAIAGDSGFALAWAGLADTYALVPFYGGQEIPRGDAYRRAQTAARRAIALAPDLAEAHASLAFALVYGSWDFETAEAEYRRALALDPDYPVAHYWYMELLIIQGRLEDALAHAERAVALAPAAPIAHHLLGVAAYYVGDHERAEREERTALTLEPDFTFPHYILGILALDRGEWQAAQEHLEAFGFPRAVVGPIVAARRDPSRRRGAILAIDSVRRSLGSEARPEATASLYGALDVPDSVLAYLERGLAQRSEAALLFTRNPVMGSAIHDPRMAELRARYDLPE